MLSPDIKVQKCPNSYMNRNELLWKFSYHQADDIRLRLGSIPSKITSFAREKSNFFFFFFLPQEPSLDNDYQYFSVQYFFQEVRKVPYIYDIKSNLISRSSRSNQSKDHFLSKIIKVTRIIYKIYNLYMKLRKERRA